MTDRQAHIQSCSPAHTSKADFPIVFQIKRAGRAQRHARARADFPTVRVLGAASSANNQRPTTDNGDMNDFIMAYYIIANEDKRIRSSLGASATATADITATTATTVTVPGIQFGIRFRGSMGRASTCELLNDSLFAGCKKANCKLQAHCNTKQSVRRRLVKLAQSWPRSRSSSQRVCVIYCLV